MVSFAIWHIAGGKKERKKVDSNFIDHYFEFSIENTRLKHCMEIVISFSEAATGALL